MTIFASPTWGWGNLPDNGLPGLRTARFRLPASGRVGLADVGRVGSDAPHRVETKRG
jgi:hypothetical protein